MHLVLQRTRPASTLTPRPASKFRTLLRSFFAGKRGLVLLALVSGAALSSQALHGWLRQGSDSAPGTPAGGDGREEAASSVEPAEQPAHSPGGPRAAAHPPSRNGAAGSRGTSLAESGPASPARARRQGQAGEQAVVSASLRPSWSGDGPAIAGMASSPAQPSRGWGRPSRSRPGADSGAGVIREPWPDAMPRPGSPATVAAPPLRPAPAAARGQAGVRQLGTVSLSDLDPSLVGVPCSDSTAALPSDRPTEEAWLPGSDASSALNAEALDPIPVPPIYSESPDRAAGPSLHSLQANRNTPCLLKQPAGRN